MITIEGFFFFRTLNSKQETPQERLQKKGKSFIFWFLETAFSFPALEPGTPRFQFALGSANYAADPACQFCSVCNFLWFIFSPYRNVHFST